MSKKFLSGINVTGTATLNTVANAGLDTDKFLVLDAAGNVDFRTGAELRLDIGADVVSKVQHEVKLGETMTIGTPVYVPISQDSGTNMTVLKASNAGESTSSKTMGLIASSGITNDLVQVVTEGLLEGINTGSATKGDPVWLGVDGALIFGLANKPVAPAHLVFLGIVTRAQTNNGEIFVKVQNGFEMNEIHNYLEGSVQNNEVIVYESATSLYKPKSIPTILGYTPVPDSRTITINGTTYDLSENRAWTITTDASARSILRYVATAGQTIFTISGGYTPGLTDVYRNGVKLDNSTDFTATNGTTIVLTNGASVNDVIEVYRYQTAFLANNALRVITEFVATAGQTTFNVTYNTGLVDVFYNGSKLVSAEYTAGNGTSIVLNFPCNVNDTLEVHAYSYQVGAFVGQSQLNGTGFVKVSGTTVTYDNSTYLTSINSSQVTTALGYTPYNSTNPSNYITLNSLSVTGPLTYNSTTGAFNINQASSTVSGWLSYTDWVTFNNKQSAGNYVTTDTTQTISGAKTFTTQLWIGSNAVIGGSNGQIQFEAASSSDLFISCIPGTRTLQIRNGNAGAPNYSACGLITGYGTFTGILDINDKIRIFGANQFWFNNSFRGQIVNYGSYSGGTDWSPFFTSETSLAFGVGGNATKAINIASDGVTSISNLRTSTLYTEYTKNLSGSYSNGNWYEIVNSSQLSSGIYVVKAYVDTYAIGGGTYFCTYVSVPFFFYTQGTNNTGAMNLPTMIGSGHAGLNPPSVRVRLSSGSSGGLTYIDFNPNADWSNVQGVAGATVTFYLKRIGD